MTKEKKENINSNDKKFSFDKSFQEKIVQAMIMDRQWAIQFNEVLDINYFNFAHLKLVTNKYLKHYSKFKEFPSMDLLLSMIKEELKHDTDVGLKQQVKEFLINVEAKKDLGDLGFVKEKALDFCKRASMQIALEKSIGLVATEKYEKVVDEIKKAVNAGNSHSPGLDLFDDIDARYSETYRKTIPTGIPELDEKKILNGGLGGGEIGFVVAPSGCHVKGTKILMYDGSLKNVEDIIVGDQIMGPDSKPRNVLRLVRGNEEMYKVKTRWGYEHVFNESHTLALSQQTTGKNILITIKDYMSKSEYFKKRHYWQQPENGIEFDKKFHKDLPINPYILGLLLGDGYVTEKRIEITTADIEISDSILEFAKKRNIGVSKHTKKYNKAIGYYFTNHKRHNSELTKQLKELGLVGKKSGDKFIPEIYKITSKENRLELLAGLLDTDGWYNKNHLFEITTKSEVLAKDILFLVRSLGFSARHTIKHNKQYNQNYQRISIGGYIENIPTRINRKKATRTKQRNKRHNVCSFTINKVGKNDYYGITVDSDNLYLSEHVDVIKNCGKSHILTHLGASALKHGKNVIHYTFELNERVTGIRYDSNLTDIPSLDCFDSREEIRKFYETNKENFGRLIVKYFPTGQASCQTLRAHMDKLQNKGFIPDMVIIDYAGIMRSADRNELLRLELKKVCEELRAMAGELDIPIWSAIQSNKEGANSDIVDLTNMAESYGQAHVADFVMGLSRQSAQKATGFGNLFIAKNRAGIDGIKYCVHLDTSRSKIRILTDSEAVDFAQQQEQDALKLMRVKFKELQEEKK